MSKVKEQKVVQLWLTSSINTDLADGWRITHELDMGYLLLEREKPVVKKGTRNIKKEKKGVKGGGRVQGSA